MYDERVALPLGSHSAGVVHDMLDIASLAAEDGAMVLWRDLQVHAHWGNHTYITYTQRKQGTLVKKWTLSQKRGKEREWRERRRGERGGGERVKERQREERAREEKERKRGE